MESNESVRVPFRERRKRHPSANPDSARSTVTDFVSAAWAGLICYFVCDAAHARHPGPWTWLGLAAAFCAACACLQRWRWGRWAVLGMAAFIVTDAAAGAVRCAGSDGLLTDGLTGFLRWSEDVLEAYGCGEPIGGFIIGLSAFTLVWFSRAATHVEFERNKRACTRRCQFCLAAAVVALFLLGLSGSGIAGRVRVRAASGADAMMRGMALTPFGLRMASRVGAGRPVGVSTTVRAGR